MIENENDILRRVRKIEIKTRGLSNEIFAGKYHTAFRGRGMSFSEVREYRAGDDVRDIDWNVTARSRSPHIKVYEEERDIMRLNLLGSGFPKPNRVIEPEDIVKARAVVSDVYMDEKIEKYIVDIIFATREPAEYNLQKLQTLIAYGGSPRASISLAKAARAYAFIRRRGYVIPEDVRAVCHDVLRHRIGLTYEAEAENVTSEEIITQILNNVEVP